MPVFPPVATVTVLVDGRPISAYYRAYLRNGRVLAPVRPYLDAFADRIWYDGTRLVIQCAGRITSIRMGIRTPDALDRGYVPLAAVARALGAQVTYRGRELDISRARLAVASPTPVPSTAMIAPRGVFTPMPVPTPRPTWNGPALPRRTPLPYSSQSPSLQ